MAESGEASVRTGAALDFSLRKPFGLVETPLPQQANLLAPEDGLRKFRNFGFRIAGSFSRMAV